MKWRIHHCEIGRIVKKKIEDLAVFRGLLSSKIEPPRGSPSAFLRFPSVTSALHYTHFSTAVAHCLI